MSKKTVVWVFLFAWFAFVIANSKAEQQDELPPQAYLPIVLGPPAYVCATSSQNQYASGIVEHYDNDNPVRPAYDHADKNIELRSYTPNTDPGLVRELVDYGSGDPTQPPQFATLFSPYRVPIFADFHQVYQWDWEPSPDLGTRSDPIPHPPVTAVSFNLPPGTYLHTPLSGYDIGGG